MFWTVTVILVMWWVHVLGRGNTAGSFHLYISLYAASVILLVVSLKYERMIHRKLKQIFRLRRHRGQEI